MKKYILGLILFTFNNVNAQLNFITENEKLDTIINNKINPQPACINGTITDVHGKPVLGVNVSLVELKNGLISNEQGYFRFDNLKAGTYTLKATFIGYKTLSEKIKIEDGKILNLTLKLVEISSELKEIIVVGYVGQNDKPVTIGKLPIRPLDLPQGVMTLDKSLLDAQQVYRMSDVLMNTNGVYISGATGGYQEEFSSRGFSMGSTNTFKNGMRYSNGMISELSGIEKVEFLKGSTAILFGNVAAGGILNLITKKPKFNFGGEVGLRTGSWSMQKPTFDIYGGLSKRIAARVNATYEKANSFRVGVSSERVYINPSFLFKFSDKTDLLIESDYLDDQRTPDFGSGIINYKIVDIPRERFVGIPWSYIKSTQANITSTLTHKLNTNWNLRVMLGIRQNSSDLFSNTRPNTGTAISQNGIWIRNLQKTNSKEDYNLAQFDLSGNIVVAGMKHQVLIGTDIEKFKTITNAYTQFARYDTVNIFKINEDQGRLNQPIMAQSTTTTAPVNRFGVYFQDLIHLSDKFKLLTGLRYSYQQTSSEVYTFSTNKTGITNYFDGAYSPRFGLVYQPAKSNALFASYSNSFTLNTGVDINNNALPPSFIDQYELGSKNDFFQGKLSINVTAYHILNKNLAQISLANGNTNTNIKELAGSIQSEGIEIDLSTKPILGISVTGGYSYNQTKYVKSNTYIEGSLLRYNPNHTGNIGFQFRKNDFQFGLTTVYIGERYAGRSTRITVTNDAYRLIKLPSYIQSDLTIGYSIKRISIRAKAANLFDVISYNVHDDNSVNPITPRNYSVTLTYNW